MTIAWSRGIFILALLTHLLCSAQSRAASLPQDLTASTAFTFGNLQFAVTSCTLTLAGSGSSCAGTAATDNVQIEAVSNGRGGTEIEFAPITACGGSYIFCQGSGTGNTTLTFTYSVTQLAKSRGVSAITDMLTSNATNANILASASVHGPSGANPSATTFNITGATAGETNTASFGLTSNTLTVTMTLADNSYHNGATLDLGTVTQLFFPAPEPASLALLATGLAGMTAARRRFKRKQPTPQAGR